MTPLRLSICIATFNRERYITETLETIVPQLQQGVELVIVDGASSDGTAASIARFLAPDRPIRYFREPTNSGVDADYDKAVGYAGGEYCWLMTDDDLIEPSAVMQVLCALLGQPDAVILNARVLDAELSIDLKSRLLADVADCTYPGNTEAFFASTASHLSFIGCVVVRRAVWLARNRGDYIGSLFVHVGVLFQAPLAAPVKFIAEPLIRIRYGNAMWTPRGFEIWTFKWPQLIWNFANYADEAKARVTAREPWKSLKRLVLSRAIGSYSVAEYRRFIAGRRPHTSVWQAWFVAHLPGTACNAVAAIYCLLVMSRARIAAYDLARSPHATWLARLALRRCRA